MGSALARADALSLIAEALRSLRVRAVRRLFAALAAVCATAALGAGPATLARTIEIGPHRLYKSVADAARIARNGDTVEIDAGDYIDDVASWPQSDLVIRAVGGIARLSAPNASAEDKAIWVIKGDNVVVENIAFADQHVPDKNGAGIRHEGGRLTVRHCLFERNEMGILTWGSETAELEIDASEFRNNAVAGEYRPGGRIGHQIYAGTIARFTLTDSYVHGGAYGHLVKSRARESFVYYNMIADDADGRSSYELEFPNGGTAYVVGNVIVQSAQTDNPDIVSIGAEGYRWPRNDVYLVNNTLVDRMPRGGTFVRVHPGGGEVKAVNNLIVGNGAWGLPVGREARNLRAQSRDFASPSEVDFRLRSDSKLIGEAIDPGSANGIDLRPVREYVHPTASRAVAPDRYNPGAMQSVAR